MSHISTPLLRALAEMPYSRHEPDPDGPLGSAAGAPDHGGWVLLYRSLVQHELWLKERFTGGQAWVDLILLASHKDHICTTGNVSTPVRRGQVLTSQIKLAQRWRWDRETVRRFLKLLEALKMCHIETSNRTSTGYTLITLLNYDRFQRMPTEDPALDPTLDPTLDPAVTQQSASSRAPLSKKGKEGKRTSSPAPDAPEVTGNGHLQAHDPAPVLTLVANEPPKSRPARGRPESQPIPSDVVQLETEFRRLFEERTAAQYPANHVPRDRMMLKALVSTQNPTTGAPAYNLEYLLRLVKLFFKAPPQWVRDLNQFDIPAFTKTSTLTHLIALDRENRMFRA